jgi:hypothetical protein
MTTDTLPRKTAICFAGTEILAAFLDGSETLIRVRAMPVRHLGRVLALCTDEAKLLEFVCMEPTVAPADRLEGSDFAGWRTVPEGWADNLVDRSHVELLEAAKQLNFSRAAAWAERQIAAKQFQGPILMQADEALMPLVEKMTRLALSSLPAPASPAAPSTKS